MDKTAEEFRKAHAERQNLINQWENTIDQMQKRDQEMDLLASVSSYKPIQATLMVGSKVLQIVDPMFSIILQNLFCYLMGALVSYVITLINT